jgi:hypothetical protein
MVFIDFSSSPSGYSFKPAIHDPLILSRLACDELSRVEAAPTGAE